MLVWAYSRSYIYKYNTGRNLTIFDKDYNTAEGSRSRIASNSPGSGGSYSQAYGFATITMYSWWRLSEIEWLTKIAARLRVGVEAGCEQSCGKVELKRIDLGTLRSLSPCTGSAFKRPAHIFL